MSLTHSDRRRLVAATVLTIAAFPALWWANRDGAAPNVATVGVGAVSDDAASVDAGADGAATSVPVAAASATTDPGAQPATSPGTAAPVSVPPVDERGEPVFFDGPAGQAGAARPEIAVPPAGGERLVARATFRSDVGSRSACVVPGLFSGETVTIVNLDNSRSTTCTTVMPPSGATEVIVHPDRFGQIADLTDAPVPVEIRR
jgi:hypothetical protein